MNPICVALKKSAEWFWAEARRVNKSEPERAEALRSLAKAAAKEADEIANKQAASRNELC